MSRNECEAVTGGWALLIPIGAVLAWAFANRAALVEIGQAASARNAELDAAHD